MPYNLLFNKSKPLSGVVPSLPPVNEYTKLSVAGSKVLLIEKIVPILLAPPCLLVPYNLLVDSTKHNSCIPTHPIRSRFTLTYDIIHFYNSINITKNIILLLN